MVQCKKAVESISSSELIEVNFEEGKLSCKKGVFDFPPLPELVLGILKDGGLIPHTKKILKIKEGE